RARPERVPIGIGVSVRSLVDARDQFLDALPPLIGIELDLGAEPRRVGLSAPDDERTVGPAQPPADDLVDGPRHGVGGLYSDPGVDTEDTLHAQGARAVHLHDGLRRSRWIGREAR